MSIEVRGLTKRFGGFLAVDGVSFLMELGGAGGVPGALAARMGRPS